MRSLILTFFTLNSSSNPMQKTTSITGAIPYEANVTQIAAGTNNPKTAEI